MYNRVVESSKNIRTLARESLKGKWMTAILATIVYVIALMLPASIIDVIFGGEDHYSSLSGLYTFLVTGPFTMGYSMFILNLFRRKEANIGQIFYGFEKFFKVMGLYIVMCIFITLWTLLFIIPGIIAAYRYSQAFFILIDHPEYGIMQCLAESKAMMTGNKGKLFCLELSFIGWMILSAIPAGIISFIFEHSSAAVVELAALVGEFFMAPVIVYLTVATAGFYDMANGKLRTGVIDVEPLQTEESQTEAPQTEEE